MVLDIIILLEKNLYFSLKKGEVVYVLLQ
jgi:hypothetical protein